MRAAKLYVGREDYLTNARIYLPARYFYLFDGESWFWASENMPKFVEIKLPTPDRHSGLRA